MMCMSAPVSVMSPLLSHRDRKATRAARLSKMIPITYVFFHYMVSLPRCVKAEIGEGGSEKRDYRNRWGSHKPLCATTDSLYTASAEGSGDPTRCPPRYRVYRNIGTA